MQKDFYEILGVPRDASKEAIAKSYKRLAKEYHPDRQHGKTEQEKKEAEEKFKAVAEAYAVLSDDDKRREYDTFGTVDGSGSMHSSDLEEFIRRQMHGMGEMFFGNMGQWSSREPSGTDKDITVNTTLRDVYLHNSVEVKYSVWERCKSCRGTGNRGGAASECPHCHGTGFVTIGGRNGSMMFAQRTPCHYCHGSGKYVTDPCPDCGGQGAIMVNKVFKTSPLYIDDFGKRFVINGGGDACLSGKGRNGNLYYSYRMEVDDKFTLMQDNPLNIVTEVEIPIIDCILGTDVEIAHLDGKKYTVKIDEGVCDGQLCRLRGKGLTTSSGISGDLYVRIKARMPKKLDNSDRKLLNKLKKSDNFK